MMGVVGHRGHHGKGVPRQISHQPPLPHPPLSRPPSETHPRTATTRRHALVRPPRESHPRRHPHRCRGLELPIPLQHARHDSRSVPPSPHFDVIWRLILVEKLLDRAHSLLDELHKWDVFIFAGPGVFLWSNTIVADHFGSVGRVEEWMGEERARARMKYNTPGSRGQRTPRGRKTPATPTPRRAVVRTPKSSRKETPKRLGNPSPKRVRPGRGYGRAKSLGSSASIAPGGIRDSTWARDAVQSQTAGLERPETLADMLDKMDIDEPPRGGLLPLATQMRPEYEFTFRAGPRLEVEPVERSIMGRVGMTGGREDGRVRAKRRKTVSFVP